MFRLRIECGDDPAATTAEVEIVTECGLCRLVAPADMAGGRIVAFLDSAARCMESKMLARPLAEVAMKQGGRSMTPAVLWFAFGLAVAAMHRLTEKLCVRIVSK